MNRKIKHIMILVAICLSSFSVSAEPELQLISEKSSYDSSGYILGAAYELVAPILSAGATTAIVKTALSHTQGLPGVNCIFGVCHLMNLLDATEQMAALYTGHKPFLAQINAYYNPLNWASTFVGSRMEESKNALVSQSAFKDEFENGRDAVKPYVKIRNGIRAGYSLWNLWNVVVNFVRDSFDATSLEQKQIALDNAGDEQAEYHRENMRRFSAEHEATRAVLSQDFENESRALQTLGQRAFPVTQDNIATAHFHESECKDLLARSVLAVDELQARSALNLQADIDLEKLRSHELFDRQQVAVINDEQATREALLKEGAPLQRAFAVIRDNAATAHSHERALGVIMASSALAVDELQARSALNLQADIELEKLRKQELVVREHARLFGEEQAARAKLESGSMSQVLSAKLVTIDEPLKRSALVGQEPGALRREFFELEQATRAALNKDFEEGNNVLKTTKTQMDNRRLKCKEVFNLGKTKLKKIQDDINELNHPVVQYHVWIDLQVLYQGGGHGIRTTTRKTTRFDEFMNGLNTIGHSFDWRCNSLGNPYALGVQRGNAVRDLAVADLMIALSEIQEKIETISFGISEIEFSMNILGPYIDPPEETAFLNRIRLTKNSLTEKAQGITGEINRKIQFLTNFRIPTGDF